MAASTDKEIGNKMRQPSDVYESILTTMNEKLKAMEDLLSAKYADNMSAAEKYQVFIEKCIEKLSSDTNKTKKTFQDIQAVTEQNAKMSALHENAAKMRDREFYEVEMERDITEKESAKLEADKKSLETERSKALEKFANLKQNLKRLKDCFAMEMKKNKHGQLMFIFNNVNPDDPEETFFFTLNLADDQKYVVHDCSPVTHDLDTLLIELNTTNDLGRFVSEMRKRFRVIANECRITL